jgi:hypothetical protein
MLSAHFRPHRVFAAALACDIIATAPHRGWLGLTVPVVWLE